MIFEEFFPSHRENLMWTQTSGINRMQDIIHSLITSKASSIGGAFLNQVKISVFQKSYPVLILQGWRGRKRFYAQACRCRFSILISPFSFIFSCFSNKRVDCVTQSNDFYCLLICLHDSCRRPNRILKSNEYEKILPLLSTFLLTAIILCTDKNSFLEKSRMNAGNRAFRYCEIKRFQVRHCCRCQWQFYIRAKEGDVLVISGAGLAEKEVNIGNDNNLSIQLPRNQAAMTEVFVTGYTTKIQENFRECYNV